MDAKIGSQRHLIAIRDGFIAIMPVTMVGSIAVLLNVFLRDLPNEWLGEGNGFVAAMDPIIAINGNVYFGSITVLGIAFTISLGYHLSKSYDVNPIAGAVIAFSAVVTCMNQNAVFNYILNGVDLSSLDSLKAAGLDVSESEGAVALQNVSGWGHMGEAYTGSSGLFTCLIVGLLSTMIYVKLMQKKGSWAVFFMVIGMTFIMLSPQVEQPMSLIVTGLAIILISLIYWKKERSRDDQK